MYSRPLNILLLLVLLCFITSSAKTAYSEDSVNVLIWDEQQPRTKQAYPNFIGNFIADHLRTLPGLNVTTVKLDDPQQGLSKENLDQADVLIWWGHRRHDEISDAQGRDIVRRIKEDGLGFIVLHSAHWATPFVQAMNERAKDDALAGLPKNLREHATFELIDGKRFNAPDRDDWRTPSWLYGKNADGTPRILLNLPNCCFPAYRGDGAPSHLTTLRQDHPIAQGIPKTFTLPQTEMYDEPFHVPDPDLVIFEERWDLGEYFRAGMLWEMGKGKLFYFRPGHETYKVFYEEAPLKILDNTVRWMAKEKLNAKN